MKFNIKVKGGFMPTPMSSKQDIDKAITEVIKLNKTLNWNIGKKYATKK